MTFDTLLTTIDSLVADRAKSFPDKSKAIVAAIGQLSVNECISLGHQIHVIPERFGHDSTEEKLYAKASDAIVASTLAHLGFTTRVLEERGDAADIIGESSLHGYSFVADSKVMRLSRTAKNQKDFKVSSMHNWKGDCDHALLVCPLYQYPSSSSAIYAQSLSYNVAMIGFEHLLFLLDNRCGETAATSLRELFQFPSSVSHAVSHADRKKAKPLMSKLDQVVCDITGKTEAQFKSFLGDCRGYLSTRAGSEKTYWENVLESYKNLTRAQAIKKLVALSKIQSKIGTISRFIDESGS